MGVTGECAGRRPELRTPRKEELVEVKSEGMSRAIRRQSSADRRAEGRTRQRALRAGTNSAHSLWINRSTDEEKGGVIRSRRAGRRAAYRAGQRAGKAGRRGWISLSGGQDSGKGKWEGYREMEGERRGHR